ncbi:DNA repair protein RAD5A [Vitis vinifera]|uniref:DNA repair protein RAD5A n=1 Tax=Vitis vinifera TaxID=29760 RepID=A0A438F2U7_VITVI|nr:DNA repair protein RAD5A [Vitis vinifera]
MFRKCQQTSLRAASNSSEESVVHALPTLFRLLGLTPFKKAEFSPDDLYTRKRPLESKDNSGIPGLLSHVKFKNPSPNGNEVENEESISDTDLDNIVGVGDNSYLEERDPPSTLQCELRPYQRQALHWMIQLEKGPCMDEQEQPFTPVGTRIALQTSMWDEHNFLCFMLALSLEPHTGVCVHRRELVIYLNAFTGDATTEFPSTLKMARGGILADAMGLGKTIMTIALLLAHSEKGLLASSQSTSQHYHESSEISSISDQSPDLSKKAAKFSGFHKLKKQENTLTSGGNLIICPMTLLGQWKAEIETHAQPGSLSVYVHYGQGRLKDAKILAQNDVVITTYGVLASEFSPEVKVHWFRVVLDEAHTIKSSKSQISMAAAALIADRRWCLTGTPIQNNLEDIYSLLRFLRVEPWGNWAWCVLPCFILSNKVASDHFSIMLFRFLIVMYIVGYFVGRHSFWHLMFHPGWNKLIQKPFDEGDERGLKLVQSILKPIMLRRTKFSTDREGRPILVLPPADIQVIYCELTSAEKDFYEALFKRSKVKFDQFVEQGRVLHNYASILELLLRLRQCCDHPFLVMSRGDTQEFSDLNKLAKHFLKGGQNALEGETKDLPSCAYIQEVVEELRKGEQGECPICLEAFEDAVLTPCAHRLCRECLLASWRNPTSGFCPVCRKTISRQDLITAPTGSRFQIDVEKNWMESSKVAALLLELENLCSVGSKSILFSQWTAFLDLLQIPLSRCCWDWLSITKNVLPPLLSKLIEKCPDRTICQLFPYVAKENALRKPKKDSTYVDLEVYKQHPNGKKETQKQICTSKT